MNNQEYVIKSRRALIDAFETDKNISFILTELEPYRNEKPEISKQAATLMKICLVDMGYIPFNLQYIFRQVFLEYKCGDFALLYFEMKYRDGTLIDVWDGRSECLQNALISKTKASIVKGVNHTLASKGLQGVTIATLGSKFIETAFGEIINIKVMVESVASGIGIGVSSLYTVISAGSMFALTGALSISCTASEDIKYTLVTFVEILEYIDPPEIVKELRLDIFLDLLREELTARSIFDKDYLNYLLSEFKCYGDFVNFSKMARVPDYNTTVPFCLLLLQDFTEGDLSEFILNLIAEFCEMKDINFDKIIKSFDKLNKKTKSEAIHTQRILAEKKKNKHKRTVIDVNPYI